MKNRFFKGFTSLLLTASMLFSMVGGNNYIYAEDGAQSVVDYVKAQYQYLITHTDPSNKIVSIPISSEGYELLYDEGQNATYKEITDYLNEDIYSDYNSGLSSKARYYIKPSRYFIKTWGTVLHSKNDNKVIEIKITFNDSYDLTSSVIASNQAKIEAALSDILRDVKAAGAVTEGEKALLVHDSMARELFADLANALADDGAITTNNGVLMERKGISEGYAYLYKCIMNELGVDCDVVLDSTNHEFWNMVCVNGDYYHVNVFRDDLEENSGSTLYGDADENNSNEGYTNHDFFLITDEQMNNLGFNQWGLVKAMGDKNLSPAETSTYTTSGEYKNTKLNMAYLAGAWYIADTENISNKIIQTNFKGTSKSLVPVNEDVYYVQSDGQKLYYASRNKIIRVDKDGSNARTGVSVDGGAVITEFAIANGKLVYTVNNNGVLTEYKKALSNENWILEGCQHTWVDEVTPPTCLKRGYTTKKCSICDYTYIDESTYTNPTGHSGGTATCITKAICSVCNVEYGAFDADNHVGTEVTKDDRVATCVAGGFSGDVYCSACDGLIRAGAVVPIDPDNHTGETVVSDIRPASCTQTGYTGNTYCKDCHVKLSDGTDIPMTAHEGGVATCTKKAKCTICGNDYGVLNPNKHLNIVLENKVDANCDTDGYTGDHKCTDCNTVIDTGTVVTKLGHDYKPIVTAPTCTAKGYTTMTCSKCQDSYIDPALYVNETGHQGGTATCKKKAVCSVCNAEYGELDPLMHVNTTNTGHVDPTCTAPGSTGNTVCDDCGAYTALSTDIAALGHDYIDQVTPADCVNEGYTTCVCSRCNDSYQKPNSTVPAWGHTGGTASCVKKKKCTVCNTEYGELDASSHANTRIKKSKAATCNSEGYTGDVYCADCDALITTGSSIPLTAHNFVPIQVQPSTCLVQGYTLYRCANCPEQIETDLQPLGPHSGGQATCVSKATCAVCNVQYGNEDPTNHANTEIRNAKAATCSQVGYSGDTWCTDCNSQVATGKEVAKTTHSFNKSVTKATCTEKGYTTYTCKNCAYQEKRDYIAATGHNFVVTTTPASSDGKTPGKVVEACSKCNLVKSTTNVDYAKNMDISCAVYTYNGSKKKPSVSVTDSKGQLIPSSNYTVKYANNLNVGQATVTVTMTGKYSGTFTKNFMINPKPVAISSVVGLTKGIRVNWKKQTTQVTGYHIQYSTSSSFSSASTKSVTLTKGFNTKLISNLTAKKKYYVRMRTYTTVSIKGVKTKVYSTWSSVKNAKAK